MHTTLAAQILSLYDRLPDEGKTAFVKLLREMLCQEDLSAITPTGGAKAPNKEPCDHLTA